MLVCEQKIWGTRTTVYWMKVTRSLLASFDGITCFYDTPFTRKVIFKVNLWLSVRRDLITSEKQFRKVSEMKHARTPLLYDRRLGHINKVRKQTFWDNEIGLKLFSTKSWKLSQTEGGWLVWPFQVIFERCGSGNTFSLHEVFFFFSSWAFRFF